MPARARQVQTASRETQVSDADVIERTNRPVPISWPVAGAAPLRAAEPAKGLYPSVFKRVFDIVLVLLLLPFIGLVIALLALATRRDGGPAFYGHVRIGRGGRPFSCWKIRTMVTDSGARLAAHLAADPAAAAEWARDFKLRHDPRITPLGNFLRKTSLDELPQIWNVLKGEMSFVGPRPVTREELARYKTAAKAYLAVRPGITGIWQVSGRNDIPYQTRITLDENYAKNINLKQDIKIIIKTANAVMTKTGK